MPRHFSGGSWFARNCNKFLTARVVRTVPPGMSECDLGHEMEGTTPDSQVGTTQPRSGLPAPVREVAQVNTTLSKPGRATMLAAITSAALALAACGAAESSSDKGGAAGDASLPAV